MTGHNLRTACIKGLNLVASVFILVPAIIVTKLNKIGASLVSFGPYIEIGAVSELCIVFSESNPNCPF